MRVLSSFIALLCLLAFSSCGVIPVNNSFEKAGTLQKGNTEVTGNISAYSNMSWGWDGGSTKFGMGIKNIGARVGIGLSDKTDLKFRYERLITSNVEGFTSMSYYSIIPKFALTDEEFSLLVPLSLYQYRNESWNEGSGRGTTGSIAPQLLYTFTNAKKKADLTVGVKGDLLFGGGGAILLFGSSVGAGFSNDLSKWAIRPAVGATFLSGSLIWSYGIGLQHTILEKRR